jgi:hypothetical protein
MTRTYAFPLMAALALLLSLPLRGQTILDVSAGASKQDRVAVNLALRRQFGERFRGGLELQAAAPAYRFISAKPIREGYAFSASLPLAWRLAQEGPLRLDLFLRPGLRVQGVIDPDGNDQRDSILSSRALIFEPGLLLTFEASERLRLMSGVSFPLSYEVQPSALFENNVTALHGGLGWQAAPRTQLFVKALAGPAAGGDGDTQKFMASFQAGLRFSFGPKPATAPLEFSL